MSDHRTPNRLIDEISPYLLQHAHNPVDWYPWGEEALERARRENLPILLSIGYAACHWCHVMERESFQDDETATRINASFVAVKVDREERPDLDGIYMTAVQAMTGNGGWPMTVFLTPDGEPFFAGTYFPKADQYGLPSFRKVLDAVAHAWRNHRDDVLGRGRQVVQHIARTSSLPASTELLTETVLKNALQGLRGTFDQVWGGFGQAPKFPQPMALEFALRSHQRGWEGGLDMVTLTLDRMLGGGIYDQLGGGFHRYATDGRWLVPHFEKMLYDNAQLLRLYAHAWQVTATPRYRRVAIETAEYLLREMQHPAGGFFASQDADTEGEEGRFFTWSHDELVRVAGPAVAAWYGAVPEGNWQGRNVLWTPRDPQTVAEEAVIPLSELGRRIQDGRRRLFEARARRVKPAVDDKVLAGWNGLAISALAETGRILGEPRYVEAATRAAVFVLGLMRGESGRLLRTWRDGQLGDPAYLDDYALMSEACLTLFEVTGEPRWLRDARSLADELLQLFSDDERGGFFQTGTDAEKLVIRPKELVDNAMPAGNSAAAMALQRLSALTGDRRYATAGVSSLRLITEAMTKAPTSFGHALGALDLYLSRMQEVAVVGRAGADDTEELLGEVWRRYLPNRVLAFGDPGDPGVHEATAELSPLLRDRPLVHGRATAYVCEHFVCKQPVTDPAELGAQLDAAVTPEPAPE